MPKPRLHLDADTSSKALYESLVARGHDVSRTPNQWMCADATDAEQLIGATRHGRCIFTFNVRDFLVLAQRHPGHAGIILSTQNRSLSMLIEALDRLLQQTAADDWPGQVRWLSSWMRK